MLENLIIIKRKQKILSLQVTKAAISQNNRCNFLNMERNSDIILKLIFYSKSNAKSIIQIV